MKTPAVLTVTQLNTYIKSIIDGDINLSAVFVCGEISNFTNHYRTGHFYMTLKDEKASIRAIMFSSANQRLKFMPENGMRVIAVGRISVFERDGQYQLYIEDMQPDGIGSLNIAFEQLKQKLADEGLFEQSHKKEIPKCPMKIGVITSPTGAAIRDILNVLARRFPISQVVFCGVEVQGNNAAPSISKAIERFDRLKCADVLIVGRGGGSIEELWAFNEEIVARAIYNCSIPIISAVGHETDFTISDFTADLRAPTPSAAAELAVPDWREQFSYIKSLKYAVVESAKDKIIYERDRVQKSVGSKSFLNPKDRILSDRQLLDRFSDNIIKSVNRAVSERKKELGFLCGKLNSVSPLAVISRGYAIATKNDDVISSVRQIKVGDEITLKFADGTADCTVTGEKL